MLENEMTTYIVNTQDELQKATSNVKPRDYIILKGITFFNVKLIKDVIYQMQNAIISNLVDLYSKDGNKIETKESEWDIKGLIIKKHNCFTHYTVELPFNTNLDIKSIYYHPNGVQLHYKSINNKSNGVLNMTNLPKSEYQIVVPTPFTDCNHEEAFNILQQSKAMGNVEIHAIWALNTFIKAYAKCTTMGIDINGFNDIAFMTKRPTYLEINNRSKIVGVMTKGITYSTQPVSVNHMKKSVFSGEEIPLSEYVNNQLNYINCTNATIGIYQKLENNWDKCKWKSKWEWIEAHTQDDNIRQALAEMINARNNVVHDSRLQIANTPKNKLKYDIKELTEFQIIYYMKPWHWNQYVDRFLKLPVVEPTKIPNTSKYNIKQNKMQPRGKQMFSKEELIEIIQKLS